jgi:uncharacterized damage-inducible protein DinB
MIEAVRSEFLRYRRLAEGAMAQIPDGALTESPADGSNSIAVICQHVAGNLRSRFTDFLVSDGEKPWRRRDDEFVPRLETRDAILADWVSGWDVLFGALGQLTDADLARTVTIRSQPMTVTEALLRALAHVAYHAGQIVYLAKAARGADWTSLSIPPGQSQQYNASLKSSTPRP